MTYAEAKKHIDITKEDFEAAIEEHGEAVVEAAIECGVNIEDISEAYQGHFKDDEDFAMETAEGIGAIDKNASWPNNCIDWERAARDLMMDYSEHEGHYFRNL